MSAAEIPLGSMAIARTEVRGVGPDDTVRKAHALMEEFNVDQVPILRDDGRLQGVVTRRRLALIREDWGELQVGDIEWPPPRPGLLQPPNAPLGDVFEDLFNYDFVFISGDDETVTGLVTINDVAKYLYERQR